jgi:hypothetical protein
MQTTRYEMIVRAQDPISHSQENLGNQSIFARKGIRLPGGHRVEVAYLSGDCLRHQLREAAAYGTLHAAGMLDDPQLSEGALRLLFNGGVVTGKGNASVVNIDRYRELVALFPPLALFGGCTDNRPVPGQLVVDEGNLLCSEMAHITPQWIVAWAAENNEPLESCRAAVEEVQRVRMDASLFPDKVKLLADGERIKVSQRMLKSERAHEDADSKAKAESKSAMMPRTHERLIQGALLWLGVEARTYSDLEFDAFNFVLACLLNNFRVGGKLGTGHGRLQFVAGARIQFQPTAGNLEQVGSELAPKTGDLYRAHVQARKDDLASWLRSEINS